MRLIVVAWVLAFSHQTMALDAENYELYFTQPKLDGTQDLTIQQNLVRLANSAAIGSDIHISIYHIYNEMVSEALLEANKRGVNVFVVADGSSRNRRGYKILSHGKGKLPKIPKRHLHLCKWTGCISKTKNHSKFYLFSRLTDGTKYVVAQSSANLAEDQTRHFNDLLIIKNNSELYQRYLGYWNFQFGDQKKAFSASQKVLALSKSLSVYFFPMKKVEDPIVDILSRVECVPGSVIRVAQSRFTRSMVAKKLKQLHQEGCDTQVIVRDDRGKRSPSKTVRQELKGFIEIFPYEYGKRDATHVKTILIKALDKETGKLVHWVITGSHNLNKTSLSLNGESMLRIDSTALFRRYVALWDNIKSALDTYRQQGVVAPPFPN